MRSTKKPIQHTALEKEIIAEYDQVLLGNQRTVDRYYFANKTAEVNQNIALLLIRYCVENYLQWSPEKMRDSMTMEILRQWRLAGYLRFIVFPDELKKESNLWYLAHLAYPHRIPASDKDVCLRVYKQLMNGELQKFPKGFFSGSNSMNRVCYCLNYAIDHYTSFTSIEDMYSFFGTARCIQSLREWKLYTQVRDLFEVPIVAMYLMTNDEQDIPFLFQYYRFWQVYAENERQESETRGRHSGYVQAPVDKEALKYVQVNMS